MSEQTRDEERVRLRLSLRPELAQTLGLVADGLKLDANTVAMLALSIGVRQLHYLTFPPVEDLAGVLGERSQADIAKVALDAGLSPRQR